MFPLQQGGELSFQISSTGQYIAREDHNMDHASLEGCNNLMPSNTSTGRRHRRQRTVQIGPTPPQFNNNSIGINEDYGSNNNNNLNKSNENDEDVDDGNKKMKKKMVHRDIEKRRRQEMAALCTSLRSLLPLEYVKGKRSISDHMNGAIEYINYMHKNIQELGLKKDELHRELSDCHSIDNTKKSSMVTVSTCQVGVEIAVCTDCKDEVCKLFPLSRVLQVLLEEGHTVVSCASTKVNESRFHTIQSEVGDPTAVDLSALQRRLMEEIHSL